MLSFLRNIIAAGRRGQSGVALAAAVIALLLVSISTLSVASAAELDDTSGVATQLGRVTLVKNKSSNIRLHEPFADATVGAPDIVDIVPMSDRQIYVVGRQTGTTNIMFYDKGKRLIGVIDVEVKLDTGNLNRKIQEVTGGRGIKVHDVNGKIVLSGNGGDSQTMERALDVAGGLGGAPVVNAMKLKSGQQVMLQVRFVEANRSAARSIGIRWQGILNNRLAGVVGSNSGTSQLGGVGFFGGFPTRPGGPVVPNGANGPFVFDVLTGISRASPVATLLAQLVNTSRGSLDIVLSALEDRGVLRRLAEPNLVALSGESAEFLAGGEIPVPVLQGAVAGALNQAITIQWKEWGVRLRFVPTVLADGVISLKLEPEVSDLDYARGVQINGTVIPGISSRRARTTVELRDGQSFAIAGLIEARSLRDVEQVPWLGSIPVLGALFRSTDFAQGESELVALVTPHIVRPVSPRGPRLKTPLDSTLAGNDLDFFLGGKAEIEKNPPTLITPTGAEQPITGGVAADVTGSIPVPPAAPSDPVSNFFSGVSNFFQSSLQPPAPSAPPAN